MIVSKTSTNVQLFMQTSISADTVCPPLQHTDGTHKSVWQQMVGSVGFGAVFERKKSMPTTV